MSDTLSTVATYRDPVEANLARNLLEVAGIKAYLADEETVGMVWHLSNAIGGVKLQVWADKVQEAIDILEMNRRGELTEDAEGDATSSDCEADVAADQLDQDAQAGDSADDDAEVQAPRTNREQNADRALRTAVIGLVAMPLQLYAFWLVLDVLCSEEPLSPIHRGRATLAGLISLPLIAVLCLFIRDYFFR